MGTRTTCLAALLGTALMGATPVQAQDSVAETRVDRTQALGTAGMIVGYGGPVVLTTGALIGLSGALEATVSMDDETTATGANKMTGGIFLMGTGLVMNTAGPAMLASSSVLGAKAIQDAGVSVPMAAGWTSVAGSGVQIISWVGRFAGGEGGMLALGFAGWGTGMVAGTIQHYQNQNAWASRGASQRPHERKRVTVALTPTADGAALIGTF